MYVISLALYLFLSLSLPLYPFPPSHDSTPTKTTL